jgi:hypothetical protein
MREARCVSMSRVLIRARTGGSEPLAATSSAKHFVRKPYCSRSKLTACKSLVRRFLSADLCMAADGGPMLLREGKRDIVASAAAARVHRGKHHVRLVVEMGATAPGREQV